MAFECDVAVRWLDLDAQGHVNNGKVVDLMQEARVEFLLRGPYAHLLGGGIVIVSHQVEYLGEITADDPVTVRLWTTDVRVSRFTYVYEIAQTGRPVARARSVCCLFDFDTQLPRRLAPDERAWFASLAAPTEPLRGLGAWAPGPEAHTYPFRVRWSDLDSYGHVNNVHFFDYVGEARVDFNRHWMQDAMWMLARQDLTYVGQLEHRLEPFAVTTGIARVGRTSFTAAQHIVDPADGRVLSRSTVVMVHADADGRPRPIDPAQREVLGRWPAVPARP